MSDVLVAARPTLYELELIGEVQRRSGVDGPEQLSATFSVAALWPEAAQLAGHQLYLDSAARHGFTVQPGVRVCHCEPAGH